MTKELKKLFDELRALPAETEFEGIRKKDFC